MMCVIKAVGMRILSLTRKAGLIRNTPADTENSENPPKTVMQKPSQFQKNKESDNWAGVCRLFPNPSRLRSTATFVPSQREIPLKCVACTKG